MIRYQVTISPVEEKQCEASSWCFFCRTDDACRKLFITAVHGHHILAFILNLQTFDSETLWPSWSEKMRWVYVCVCVCVCVFMCVHSTNKSNHKAVKVVMRWNLGSGNHNRQRSDDVWHKTRMHTCAYTLTQTDTQTHRHTHTNLCS